MNVAASTLIAVMLFVGSSPAAAQDQSRRNFAFFERHLAIEVDPAAPGTVHIVRGQPGRLEVTGRSLGGFAAYDVAGHSRERLRLSPVGARHAEYMVVVPEHVRVRLALPDGLVDVPGWRQSVSYEWEAPVRDAAGRAAPAHGAGAVRADGVARGGLPVAWQASAADAPRRLTLADPGSLRSLDVRIGGSEFIIATSRVLAMQPGSGAHLELHLGADAAEVIVTVPAGADFEVLAGGTTMLSVRAGRATTTCEPVIVQRLRSEERYTFTPIAGAMTCR